MGAHLHWFCSPTLLFQGDSSERKGQQCRAPSWQGLGTSGDLQAPLQCVPGTATCLTVAAPLALALWGRRGAASCCQTDPEIAVTSGTQLGSARARAAYVRRLSPHRVAGLVILDVASQGRVRALSRGSRRPL